MTKEDYIQYYIQGSDHYLIPKDIFDELYDEMNNWKRDVQKYKEVIKKVKKLIIDNIEETTYEYIGSNKIKALLELKMDDDSVNELLKILKEVK